MPILGNRTPRMALAALLAPRATGRKLEHLTGLRFVLILWVVVFHASCLFHEPHAKQSVLDAIATQAFTVRPYSQPSVHYAVAGFVVMSGFVTQWSQGTRSPGCGRGLTLFYIKRLDRVLLTTWIGMAVDQVARAARPQLHSPLRFSWREALCYLQLAPWVAPQWPSARTLDHDFGVDQCPDPASWTIGVLVFQWLIYPVVTQRVVNQVAARAGAVGLAVLSSAALFLSFLSDLLLWLSRHTFATGWGAFDGYRSHPHPHPAAPAATP